jgi:hypothetical protein
MPFLLPQDDGILRKRPGYPHSGYARKRTVRKSSGLETRRFRSSGQAKSPALSRGLSDFTARGAAGGSWLSRRALQAGRAEESDVPCDSLCHLSADGRHPSTLLSDIISKIGNTDLVKWRCFCRYCSDATMTGRLDATVILAPTPRLGRGKRRCLDPSQRLRCIIKG